MEFQDRIINLGLFAAAVVVWALVAIVVTTTYPREDAVAGLMGAGLIGVACGLTTAPLFWLAVFARHKRIAFTGDWSRALRRGGWVAVVVALFVALRVQGVFSAPIGLFVLAMVLLAEVALSIER